MFQTSIQQKKSYDFQSEKFQLAYQFFRRNDLAELPVGAIPLGLDVTVHIQHYTTISAEQLKFEAHNKFFDVQFMIEGCECFGIADRSLLKTDVEYDAEKDIEFFQEPGRSSKLSLCTGDYVIVEPETAHKPRCVSGEACFVKKAVVKIPV